MTLELVADCVLPLPMFHIDRSAVHCVPFSVFPSTGASKQDKLGERGMSDRKDDPRHEEVSWHSEKDL